MARERAVTGFGVCSCSQHVASLEAQGIAEHQERLEPEARQIHGQLAAMVPQRAGDT